MDSGLIDVAITIRNRGNSDNFEVIQSARATKKGSSLENLAFVPPDT